MKNALCILSFVCILLSGRLSSVQARVTSPPGHSRALTMTLRHTVRNANTREMAGVLALAVGVGLAQIAVIAGAIAYQFPRTLAYDPSNEWEDADYFRALPNALTVLSENHFASAWPRHCNPWCMNRFQRRLERALAPLLKSNVQRFVRQHLSAWRWTISHRHMIARLLETREREYALGLLAAANPDERIALLAILNNSHRDHWNLRNVPITRMLRQLDRLQAILREHGYSLRLKADPVDQRWMQLSAYHPAPTAVKRRIHQTFVD